MCQPNDDLELGENYFESKPLLLPHYEAKSPPTPLRLSPSQLMKQNETAVATKRKQLSSDALLPKRTIKPSHQQVASSANMLPSTISASESEVVKTPAVILPEITIQDNNQTNNPKDIFNFVNSLTDA